MTAPRSRQQWEQFIAEHDGPDLLEIMADELKDQGVFVPAITAQRILREVQPLHILL